MKIPVEGQPGLYRDSETGLLLMASDAQFSAYQRSKQISLKEKQEINELRGDVNELKDMMKLILSKLDTTS